MGITDSTCPGQLLCPHSDLPCVRTQAPQRAKLHPQPLLTAIPAWVRMSGQIVGSTVGLALDPLNWRARLVGAPPSRINYDTCSEPKPCLGVSALDAAQAPNGMSGSPPDLYLPDPQPVPSPATMGKCEKKTVHFIEPAHDAKPVSGSGSVDSLCDRAKVEIYEAISQPDDIPRVIEVGYDCENDRWLVDKSATFPHREGSIVMICTRSVLQAMKHGINPTTDLVGRTQFQVNRLLDYGVIKHRDGDLAAVNASSHDFFHITNLDKFLLHAHKHAQHVIAASGGQHMKHWLIPLQQLVTILSRPDAGRNCKAAFWELARRGVAEKVTLQLWDAGDPQPEDPADIENMEWTTWVRAYKDTIPDGLRQDLVRALGFFRASAVPESSWPAVLHPNLSILSHKGITSAVVRKSCMAEGMQPLEAEPWSRSRYVNPISPEKLGKAAPNYVSNSSPPCFAQETDGVNLPPAWWPSAEDPTHLCQSQHMVHGPSPHPYSRPLTPPLPDSLVARFSAREPQKIRLSNPRNLNSLSLSKPPRPNEPLGPLPHKGMIQEHQRSGSLNSTSLSSESLISSDASAASYEFDGTGLFSEADVPLKHGQAPATVDYGKVTGGLIKPTGRGSNTSNGTGERNKCVAAHAEKALHRPKESSAAHKTQRPQPPDPELAESQARAKKILGISIKKWEAAAAKHGMTDDNTAMPVLNIDIADGSDIALTGQIQFSNQLNEVLHAEQRVARSATMTQMELEEYSEKWAREQGKLSSDRQIKLELKKILTKEWAHLRWGDEDGPLQEALAKVTDLAKDAFNCIPGKALPGTEVSFLSDEHTNEQFETARSPIKYLEEMCLPDGIHKAIKAEVRRPLRQLKKANETAAYLKVMLDASDRREKEANERKKQKDKALEGTTEELRELRVSLRANAKDGQGLLAGVCYDSERLQDMCENRSAASANGALDPINGDLAEEKPGSEDSGVSKQNDTYAGSMSPSPNGRSIDNGNTQPEIGSSSIHAIHNSSNHASLHAGSTHTNNGEDINLANIHSSTTTVGPTHSTNSVSADEVLSDSVLAAGPGDLLNDDSPRGKGLLVAVPEDGNLSNGDGVLAVASKDLKSGVYQSPSSPGKKKATTGNKWTTVKRKGKAK